MLQGEQQESLNSPQFQQEQASDISEFGNQYLNNIPEHHRNIVAQYVNDWDKGVTQKFQEYSGKLKGYEELGDLDYLKSAAELVGSLNEDPNAFYRELKNYIDETYGEEEYMDQENEKDQGGLPEFEGIPEEFVSRYQDMENRVSQFEEKFGKFEEEQINREQTDMLDSVLQELHNEHGDFDEQWMLGRFAAGSSPEEAINEWQQFTQSIIDSRKSEPPPIFSGTGGTPLDQVDMEKLRDPKTRKELGTELLKAQLQR